MGVTSRKASPNSDLVATMMGGLAQLGVKFSSVKTTNCERTCYCTSPDCG